VRHLTSAGAAPQIYAENREINVKNQYLLLLIVTTVIGVAAQSAFAQSTPTTPGTVPADNSKSNKLDPSNTTSTADAQKDNTNDRTITQNIRKSLMSDKSLSTYAHNVKIVTVNGTVTLNGVVRSDQEKSAVESAAAAVVGQSRVVNDLKVTPPKS
jgi:hyperosmotically inducible periplasmic protein